MIILTEVAQTLFKILNGFDPQNEENENPTPYYFDVQTEGFHIDHIKKPQKNGNFIPVFLCSMGGQFNPVKGLKQGSYTLQLSFYYPVKFKNDFYALGEFLADTFVGSTINYGTVSGKAVSNIGIPTYGELQGLDFQQMKEFVSDVYSLAVDERDTYMQMVVILYLSNAAPGLVYGNDVKVDFSFTYNDQTCTLKDIDWDGSSIQSTSQAQSEQEEGKNEGEGWPFSTAYGSSFKIYPNLQAKAEEKVYIEEPGVYDPNAEYFYLTPGGTHVYIGKITQAQYDTYHENNVTLYLYGQYLYFYKELLKVWLSGNIQQVNCNLTFTIADDPDLKYTRECFIQSVMAPIEKGQLFCLTLSFTKKSEEEEPEVEEAEE